MGGRGVSGSKAKGGGGRSTSNNIGEARSKDIIGIQAKDEKDVIRQVNKQLKGDGTGRYWRAKEDKGGYFGSYTFEERFGYADKTTGKIRSKGSGGTAGSFSVRKESDGTYSIKHSTGSGYAGQD